jgi:hypothetical protein
MEHAAFAAERLQRVGVVVAPAGVHSRCDSRLGMASGFLSRRDWHLYLLRAKDTMPFKRWLTRVGAERLDE